MMTFWLLHQSLLVALTKEQLFCIADYYLIEVTIPKRSNKDQFVDFIRERLKEKQVLSAGPLSSARQDERRAAGRNEERQDGRRAAGRTGTYGLG